VKHRLNKLSYVNYGELILMAPINHEDMTKLRTFILCDPSCACIDNQLFYGSIFIIRDLRCSMSIWSFAYGSHEESDANSQKRCMFRHCLNLIFRVYIILKNEMLFGEFRWRENTCIMVACASELTFQQRLLSIYHD